MAKGLAALGMIQVHIGQLWMDVGFREAWPGGLSLVFGGPLVAPVFLMVFGYFLFRPSVTPRQVLRRAVYLLLLGMLLNGALNATLFWHIAYASWQVSPWPYLFGVDILVHAGFACVVVAGLKRLAVGPAVLLALITGTVVLTPWLNTWLGDAEGAAAYLAALLGGAASWSYFPLFPWLAYVLVGGLLAMRPLTAGKWGSGIAVAVAIGLGWSQLGIAVDLSLYYHHGAGFFLWVLSLCFLGWALLDHWLRSGRAARLASGLAWLGQRITAVYVLQWLIIGNVATLVYRSLPAMLFIPAVMAVLFLAIALVLVWERLGNH